MALYESIAAEIEERITSGIYKPGCKIPSIRKMAEAFGCNKLTVQKAFEKLKQEGYLENIVGSGSFVRFPEKISRIDELFDFKTAYISASFFPYLKARQLFSDLFDTEKTDAFSPSPVEGDPAFLKVLGEYYQVPTRRMLIISGAQQGLDLISKVFAARISEAMLFEDPTYPGAISLFKARHFVPLEDDGPDLDALDRKLSPRIKLFYTMPSVHNPTGISYSLEKKKEVIKRAADHSFYLIEDDYLSEFQKQPLPRFVDLFEKKTIYIKSLSQTTASGIRLGFMIVPENLYETFRYTKYTSDLVSSGLLQKFARDFIKSGDYDDYVTWMRRKTEERKKRVTGILKEYPGLSLSGSQSGYSLWVRSETTLDLPRVPWSRGEDFSFSPEFRQFFRLSFMHMDDAVFERGLTHLKWFFEKIF